MLVISTKPQNECSKLSNTQDLTSTEKQIGSVDDEDQKLSKSSTKKSGLSIFHDSMISTEKKIGSVDDEDQKLRCDDFQSSNLACNKMEIDQANVNDIYDSDAENRFEFLIICKKLKISTYI